MEQCAKHEQIHVELKKGIDKLIQQEAVLDELVKNEQKWTEDITRKKRKFEEMHEIFVLKKMEFEKTLDELNKENQQWNDKIQKLDQELAQY